MHFLAHFGNEQDETDEKIGSKKRGGRCLFGVEGGGGGLKLCLCGNNTFQKGSSLSD